MAMEISNTEEVSENLENEERISGEECRVCLKKCTEMRSLFQNGEEIPEKLIALASVQVKEGDGLPTSICLSCHQLLDISYDFKCLIERSDEKLRHLLKLMTTGERDSKNALIVKNIIANVISNVVSCKEINIANGHSLCASHEITNAENTCSAVQSDLQLCEEGFMDNQNNELIEKCNSASENKFCALTILEKDVRSLDNTERNANSENCELNLYDNGLINQATPLSNLTIEEHCIKQENRSFHEYSELSRNADTVKNQNINHNEHIFKIEIKNETSVVDIDDVFQVAAIKATDTSEDEKTVVDCSDDEEKPLIARTSRQKCPHCIKSFATKLALQRHIIVHKHKTKLRYVCYICDKQFSNTAKLKNHVFNNHETHKNDKKVPKDDVQINESEFQDKRISKNIASEEGNANISVESPKSERKNFKFTCKVCSKQFTYQKPFLTHAKSHPEYKTKNHKSKTKACNFKENESNDDDDTEDDDEEDEDDDSDLPVESLQCTQCGKLFATKRNLKRHISTHSGLKYNCSTCGKTFSRVDKLKDHEQTKHKDEMFGNTDEEAENDSDNEHKVIEASENRKKDRYNRPHKCIMCPKAFAQAQSLANHMERHQRVKDTQKRFLCEVCSKCFAQSGSLVAHMRTHTGVKPYVCNVCSRAFTKSTYLQLHLRTHSGEKPYICQYCSRAFARANTLARHITMHTGEAKYHCQICTKSFRRLTSLNEHTYTHTGQRPYACKICTKRYNNAGSLYAHTKKCKAQQLSGTTTTFTVSMDNAVQQNGNTVPQVLIYSQRKLVEDATVGQVTPTPQYMIANVHNQKALPTNIIQPFTVDDPNVYTVNTKQFKNPYYAIYPNM